MFIISNFVSSFPFLFVISFATCTVIYFMGKLGSGFDHYIYLGLVLLGCIAAVESFMLVVASLVPNYLMGVVVGVGYNVRNNNLGHVWLQFFENYLLF